MAKVTGSGALIVLSMALAVAAAAPADDLRVRQLENEVNRLRRELDVQSRRIDELERAARTHSAPRTSVSTPQQGDSSPGWLVGTNWDRLRLGMQAVEVIALLGRPTSVRTDDDGKLRALLYAMELGSGVVLAGNVQLGETGVTQVNKPLLR